MLVSELERTRDTIRTLTVKLGKDRSALLPILRELQNEYHRISDFAMQEVANALDMPPVEVNGVVSFYAFLAEKPWGRFVFRLCRSLSCEMGDKEAVASALENELGIAFGETSADRLFTLEWTSCLGMCDQGPALLVNDQMFVRVDPQMVHRLATACRKSLEGLELPRSPHSDGVPDGLQSLTFNGVKSGAALKAAAGMTRAQIIDEMAESGLRGRGGAGFPASVKWNLAAAAKDPVKYVVCNADEGEPGTFKDRLILDRYADLVFEGMTVAGRAIGAGKGILYLRQEYTYLLPLLGKTLEARRKAGLLGQKAGGIGGFDFDIEIRQGAGAYVCGEETALIESLEGNRGEPRNRPPFPVDTGYMGHPTIVNNVETLAWVACILAKGAGWFSGIGTARSKGPKLLSVSGDCERPGVYEVALGVTIAEVLEKAGGTGAKAVQVGGASGRCLPAAQFGRRICFEDIPTGGSVVVFGPAREMIDAATNFLEFFVEESCGQCTPCREGNPKLLECARMLARGQCSMSHLSDIKALAETMTVASKCGLGQTSSSAFMSILESFEPEILGKAHLGERR